jgi:hypothetical protein
MAALKCRNSGAWFETMIIYLKPKLAPSEIIHIPEPAKANLHLARF